MDLPANDFLDEISFLMKFSEMSVLSQTKKAGTQPALVEEEQGCRPRPLTLRRAWPAPRRPSGRTGLLHPRTRGCDHACRWSGLATAGRGPARYQRTARLQGLVVAPPVGCLVLGRFWSHTGVHHRSLPRPDGCINYHFE